MINFKIRDWRKPGAQVPYDIEMHQWNVKIKESNG